MAQDKDNLLDIENIKEKQDEGNEFQQSATRHLEWYIRKTFNYVVYVVCYTKQSDDPPNWKIALPRELTRPTVNWYYQVTGHCGNKRLYEQICQRFYNCDVQSYIDNFHCEFCQRNKLDGRGFGLLPELEGQSIPFEECAMDLIGPWIVQVCGNPYEFSVLTAIDTVTNLVEIIRVDNKYSETSMDNVGYHVSMATKMCP